MSWDYSPSNKPGFIPNFVNKETKEKRVSICNDCSSLNSLYQCKECMCFAPMMVWFSSKKCPLDKW